MIQGATAKLTVHVKAAEESFTNAVIDTDQSLLASTNHEIEILNNKKSLCERQVAYYQKREERATHGLQKVEALKLWKEIALYRQQQEWAHSELKTRRSELKQIEERLALQMKFLARLQSDLLESGIDIGERAQVATLANPEPTLHDWVHLLPSDDAPLVKAPMDFRICPITKDVMQDPVLAADGYTYERLAIEAWMERSNTSPITNLPLDNNTLAI